ncbi:DUF3854 domain-containing protein [Bacillus sp. SCS-151]|uniref:DUF3854 domain-containing protein n=1 Tax=Nanhaiella sioensis TaxID=3115293 RepID=UPI003978944E
MRISDKTVEKAKKVDLLFIAEQLGESLQRSGHSYFTYRNGGERTPSLSINPQRGIWKDFGGVASGRCPISFVAYRRFNEPYPKDKRFVEAVEEVCRLAGITIEYDDGQTKEFQPVDYTPTFTPKENQNKKASAERINEVYQAWLKQLPLYDRHIDHLKEVRKIPLQIARIRQFKSLTHNNKDRYIATKALLRHVRELDGIPGFALKKGQYSPYWTTAGRAGLLIPYRDIHNRVQGFQILYDERPTFIECEGDLEVHMNDYEHFLVVQKSTGEVLEHCTRNQLSKQPLVLAEGKVQSKQGSKYGWLSSTADESKGILKGAEIANPTPYHMAVPAGPLLNWTLHKGEIQEHGVDTDTIWWGEGGLKGDIAADFTKQIHLQVSGVTSWRLLLEPTIALKAKHVIIGFDADAQTKTDSVQVNVLNCIKEATKELTPLGIRLSIAIWPIEKGKGIDDIYNNGFEPQIHPIT